MVKKNIKRISGWWSIICQIGVSWRVIDCCLTPSELLVLAIPWREQVTFRRDDDDDARFVLSQYA